MSVRRKGETASINCCVKGAMFPEKTRAAKTWVPDTNTRRLISHVAADHVKYKCS